MDKSNIIKDSATYFIKKLFEFSVGPIIAAVAGCLSTFALAWFVIPDEVGKVAMYTTTLSLVYTFITLGLDRAFIREYCAYTNKRILLINCFVIPFFISIAFILVIISFHSVFSGILFGSEEKIVMVLLGLSLPLKVVVTFNSLIFRLQENAKMYSFLMIFEKMLNFIFLIFILNFINRSFRAIIFSNFLAISLSAIVALHYNRKEFFSNFKIKKEIIFKALKYGVPYVPAIIFMWILNSMDKFALRIWSTFEEIGLYSIAFHIVMILKIIQYSFSSFWTPVSYRWFEEGMDNLRFVKVSEKLTAVLVLGSGIIILLKNYIVLIFNPNYFNAAVMIPFLLFIVSMETMSYATGCGINFSRKTIFNLLVAGSTGILNLFGNYLLVPKLGGLGASISTGISFIIYFLLRTYISRKLWFKYSLRFYYINIGLMLLLASVSVFLNNSIIEILIFILITIYDFEHIKYLFKLTLKTIQSFKAKEE